MNADEHGYTENDVTQLIIGAAFKVYNTLGCGFLEKVYENALAHELRKLGLRVEQQFQIPVFYDGQIVGNYVGDLRVEALVIVELKAAKAFDPIHIAVTLNYLRATGQKVALLMNFGKPRLDFKRLVYDF